MGKDIRKLLKQKTEYQNKIKSINSELKKIGSAEFFNQMIKGRCFICNGHGHFLDENVWYIYKPQEIVVDWFTKRDFDIKCDIGYESYKTEEGVAPGYSRFEGWLRDCHHFRFLDDISNVYKERLKEVTEEEFWEELTKKSHMSVDELKNLSNHETLCYSYEGRTD